LFKKLVGRLLNVFPQELCRNVIFVRASIYSLNTSISLIQSLENSVKNSSCVFCVFCAQNLHLPCLSSDFGVISNDFPHSLCLILIGIVFLKYLPSTTNSPLNFKVISSENSSVVFFLI